jgi:hypothetical protein
MGFPFSVLSRAAEKQKGKGWVGVAGYKQSTPLGFKKNQGIRLRRRRPGRLGRRGASDQNVAKTQRFCTNIQ